MQKVAGDPVQVQPESVVTKLAPCPSKKKDQLTYGMNEINQAVKRAGIHVAVEPPIFVEAPLIKRVQKRARNADDEEEKKEGGENPDQNEPRAPPKKRAKKAAAKKEKPIPVLPREDIELPLDRELAEAIDFETEDIAEVLSRCCQTCANRVAIETARAGNLDAFIGCVKSKVQVTSLLEQRAPERKETVLEVALRHNRADILAALFAQTEPESDSRLKKKDV